MKTVSMGEKYNYSMYPRGYGKTESMKRYIDKYSNIPYEEIGKFKAYLLSKIDNSSICEINDYIFVVNKNISNMYQFNIILDDRIIDIDYIDNVFDKCKVNKLIVDILN